MNTTTSITKCRRCGATLTSATTCADCGAPQTADAGRADTLTRIRNGLIGASIIVVSANIGVAMIEPTAMKTGELRRAHVDADFYWDAETKPCRQRLVEVVAATWPKVPGCRDIDPGALAYSSSRTASFGKGPSFFVTCTNPAGVPFNYWFTLDGGASIGRGRGRGRGAVGGFGFALAGEGRRRRHGRIALENT